MTNLLGTATGPDVPGVLGTATGTEVAVAGQSGTDGYGVFGTNIPDNLVPVMPGVGPIPGLSTGAGVYGFYSGTGPGVHGKSSSGNGAEGTTTGGNGSGIFGTSAGGNGVTGISNGSAQVSGVWGNHTGGGNGLSGSSNSGNGVWGSSQKGYAGFFQGNIHVTGDHTCDGKLTVAADIILSGADCAEEFDVTDATEIEPGTVMVLDQHGALQSSQYAYDRRVAGVVSGAGAYRPGLILDRNESSETRAPLALVGKVYCKVDAQDVPIEVGDLLTTSHTPGHAMKASDPLQAFGTVIGKALRPLQSGQGLVPILVALQ
jgi:hypothetical protein